MKKLVFWEMNEINFDFVNYYIGQGKLNNWKKFIDQHGVYKTVAEKKYEELEPWIQWPTVRTGLDFAEHKIFRLGDMEASGIRQHWEILEEHGLKVAALSPINGANKTQNSPFWIPDPWVDTKVSGDAFAHRISKAVRQAVNDNAQEKLSFETIVTLIECLLTKTQLKSWKAYFKGIAGALRAQHWSKAILLDRLLADVFIALWKKHQPDFSVLFLNAGAHIQHHYMCSSAVYKGGAKNPKWYISESSDPLLEILELYDTILAELNDLPNVRLMISVGMRQVPYEDVTYYWRLRNHEDFLNKIGVRYSQVHPRMTRDFLIEFDTVEDSQNAERLLRTITAGNGTKVFGAIDNRGVDIFVTLTYPYEIENSFMMKIDSQEYHGFRDDIVFVAIKNGHHDTIGYFFDSEIKSGELEQEFPLKSIFGMVMHHFGLIYKNSKMAD